LKRIANLGTILVF